MKEKELEDICVDYCEATDCTGCKYENASEEERQRAMLDEHIVVRRNNE